MTETSTEDTSALERLETKVDQLADTVAGIVGQLHGDATKHEESKLDRPTREVQSTQQRAGSLQDEIQAELAKLRKQEEHDRQHAEMTAAQAPAPEKKPREFRRVTQAMGWVTDDDK